MGDLLKMNHIYKSVIDRLPMGYAYHKIIYDERNIPYDYEFIDINPEFEKITGLCRNEVIGKSLRSIFTDDLVSELKWIKIYGEIALSEEDIILEEYSEILRGYYKIKVFSPEKHHIVTYITDTSEEIEQINKVMNLKSILEQSEKKYKTISEYAYDWEIWKNERRETIYVSPSCERISGYSSNEFMKDHTLFESIIVEEDKGVWENHKEESATTNDFCTVEFRIRRKDGDIIWIEHTCSSIISEEGEYIGYRSNNRDITQHKELEAAYRKSEEQYRLLFENAVESILVAQDMHIKISNKMMEELTGYTIEELTQLPFTEFIHPDYREIVVNNHIQRLKGENIDPRYIFKLVRKDKSIRWVEMNSIKIEWDGKPGTLNFLTDITERKESEEALKISEAKYRLLAEHATDVIWIYNLSKDRFSYVSPAINQLLGFTPEEYLKIGLEEALTFESAKLAKKQISIAMESFIRNPERNSYSLTEFQQPCKDGDIIWVESSAKFRYNSYGEIEIIGVSRNIEQRKKTEEQILYLSYYDQLTGLYNRRFYEEELKRLDTNRSFPISLIVADVNGLKLANDAFGHKMGDKLLKAFADILKKESRAEDIVARIAGDEFVILLPKTTSEEAEKVIKRIKKAMENKYVNNMILSASFGWDTKTNMSEDMGNIFTKAEDNMYRNKLSESNEIKGETIKLINESLFKRSIREEEHCKKVSKLSEEIGRALGLSTNKINILSVLGLFHDIGKIGIDANILNKSDKLEDDEWYEIKRHSEIGYQILRSVNEFSHIAEFVLWHHERIDGKGYPQGLKGEEIPLESRILSVADAYDSITNPNSYKKAKNKAEAIDELIKNSNAQFDEEIVKVFIEKVLNQKDN